jgi:hypothetical protein
MYNTLHGDIKQTADKLRFFAIAFAIVFLWQFAPQYMFTWLTSIAVLCLIAPFNSVVNKLGSGYHGLGMLNFSLDWNAIGHCAPLYTPWQVRPSK